MIDPGFGLSVARAALDANRQYVDYKHEKIKKEPTNIYVDQSRKIEQINYHSIIAAEGAGRPSVVIIIPKEAKMKLFGLLKKRNKSFKRVLLKIFAAAVYFAVKDIYRPKDKLVIDSEYGGSAAHRGHINQDRIANFLFSFMKTVDPFFEFSQIRFQKFGKSIYAYKLKREREKADIIRCVTDELFLSLLG